MKKFLTLDYSFLKNGAWTKVVTWELAQNTVSVAIPRPTESETGKWNSEIYVLFTKHSG